ncbi:MAG: hypothetical protein QQN63_00275 [Nitrosopumilus sp.]
MKFDKPVAQGNYGGLRLRLLTSAQLGLAQLLFPLSLIAVGWLFVHLAF